MQRDLGQISFLERLQDCLQLGASLLEACQYSRGTTIQEFLHGRLPSLTGLCRRIGTPGEFGLPAATRRNHLRIKIAPRRQMGHRISGGPAWTIGQAAPVALWPVPKCLHHTGRFVGNDRNICELCTNIQGHTSSPSLYTNTASSTSKTVGFWTGV